MEKCVPDADIYYRAPSGRFHFGCLSSVFYFYNICLWLLIARTTGAVSSNHRTVCKLQFIICCCTLFDRHSDLKTPFSSYRFKALGPLHWLSLPSWLGTWVTSAPWAMLSRSSGRMKKSCTLRARSWVRPLVSFQQSWRSGIHCGGSTDRSGSRYAALVFSLHLIQQCGSKLDGFLTLTTLMWIYGKNANQVCDLEIACFATIAHNSEIWRFSFLKVTLITLSDSWWQLKKINSMYLNSNILCILPIC